MLGVFPQPQDIALGCSVGTWLGSGPHLYPAVLGKLLEPRSGLDLFIARGAVSVWFCFSLWLFLERTSFVAFSLLPAFTRAEPGGSGVYRWPGYMSVRRTWPQFPESQPSPVSQILPPCISSGGSCQLIWVLCGEIFVLFCFFPSDENYCLLELRSSEPFQLGLCVRI